MRALGVLPEPPPEPPRDEAGRFAKPPVRGFDGGARQTPPLLSRDPAADHNGLVVELLASRHVQRSAGGWSVAK
jgi:hypothetical protein